MASTNHEIVMQYMDCYCAGDIDGIEPLLAGELVFSGPLHTFESARQYLDSLRADPPEKSHDEILSVTESDDTVALFYVYHKPDRARLIAQMFKSSAEKITAMLLVFDSNDAVQGVTGD